MTNYLKHFLFCAAVVAALFGAGTLTAAAQPKKALAQLATVGACFEENEAAVASIAGGGLAGNTDTLDKLDRSLPHLEKLVGCADQGIKIAGLPVKVRRSLAARKKEYVAAHETFTRQSCIFRNLNETEAGIPDVTKKIEAGEKIKARLGTQLIRLSAAQAKLCAEQGIASKNIPPGMKSGFRDNIKRIDEMIAQIDELKTLVEKMPDK